MGTEGPEMRRKWEKKIEKKGKMREEERGVQREEVGERILFAHLKGSDS